MIWNKTFFLIIFLSTVVPLGGACGLGLILFGLLSEEPLVMAVFGSIVVVIMASLATACGIALARKPPQQPPPGICICGYSLIGNATGKCPECGRPL